VCKNILYNYPYLKSQYLKDLYISGLQDSLFNL